MKINDKRIWEKLEDKEDRWRKKRKKKEDYETVSAVIDLNTAKQIKKLQSLRIIDQITGTIASGKESGVFLALLGSKGTEMVKESGVSSPIVIKIFRTSTLNFKRIIDYVSGDVRFHKKSKNIRKIINLWADKEYKNLLRCVQANINVPKPILVRNNMLLMELLGEDGTPSPLLKDYPKAFTKEMLELILVQMERLVLNANLIHADLSAYNIIIHHDKPYFIDMSQSVLTSHPRALEFLQRDIENILYAFSSKGIPVPLENEVFESLTRDFPDIEIT
ncbi:serine protein kinase RIO [Candidatus Hodarchaeum mangrovi]